MTIYRRALSGLHSIGDFFGWQATRHQQHNLLHTQDAPPEPLFVQALMQGPGCAYTDENPARAPEHFAQHFTSAKSLAWLYAHPQHPLFSKQQTTALHTLVRLQDLHGIGMLAKQAVDFNLPEPASRLSSLNLLTNCSSENSSYVLLQSQRLRAQHSLRIQLFSRLCQHGAKIDLATLVHIMTTPQPSHLQALACRYFYQQQYPQALANLLHSLSQTAALHTTIHTFNTHCLRHALQSCLAGASWTPLHAYSQQQRNTLLLHTRKRLNSMMSQPDFLQTMALQLQQPAVTTPC